MRHSTGSYRRFSHGPGCGCSTPLLQQATRRLSALSRRGFLAGAGAAAVTGALPAMASSARPPAKTLFQRARVFDGKSGALQAGVQVLVEGNRIVSIDTSNSPPPPDAELIDCNERVLMPGLIDAHWHSVFAAVPAALLVTGDPGFIFTTATAEAERTLLRGFTTVRDLGGPTFSFKQAIDRGMIQGPRIFPSGAMITTSGGHGDLRMLTEIPRNGAQLSVAELSGGAMMVDDVGSLRQRVREQLLQGASQIKLVGSGGVSSPRSPLDMLTFTEEELRSAIDVARDWNTYATVHAYTPAAVRRAIDAGAACIEHAHLIDEDTARLIADRGIWLSFQPFLYLEDSSEQTGPSAQRLTQLIEGTPRIYDWIRKYGIKTAWGSDVLFSPELTPRQNVMLTRLSRWYTNADALRMATSLNAELLALSGPRTPYAGKLGVIEEGALADVLVVDGNPLDDIHLLDDPAKNLAVIMKDGQVYKNTLP